MMNLFGIVPLRKEGTDSIAALPQELSAEHLITPPTEGEWGLFQLGGFQRVSNPSELMRNLLVPESLNKLLVAARGYLPALVLSLLDSRNEMIDEGQDGNKEFYLECLAKSLSSRLSSQFSDPYFLAKVQTTSGELSKDAYYWLVSYDPVSTRVEYISNDLYVYDEPSGLFDVSQDQLAMLPESKLETGFA